MNDHATRALFASALALVLSAALGCGGDGGGGGDAGPDTRDAGARVEQRTLSLSPANFAEGDFVMAEGAQLVLRFESAPSPALWNIHGHVNDETTTFVEGQDVSVEQPFEAPADGHFFLLFGNGNAEDITVDVTVELSDGAEVFGWSE
jgi:hypothetical protein